MIDVPKVEMLGARDIIQFVSKIAIFRTSEKGNQEFNGGDKQKKG